MTETIALAALAVNVVDRRSKAPSLAAQDTAERCGPYCNHPVHHA